jgi:hypothetical protein
MNTSKTFTMRRLFTSMAGGACAALLLAAAAQAAPASDAQLRYRQERAACMNGTSNQERATCLREAGAALQEAKHGGLSSGDLDRNRTQRCAALPAQDREDCAMRMEGHGSTSGSVMQGGILRELERPVPARSN